jgi:predicted SnoaL-like aldol condensation-catalyzing enzyme
MTHVQLEAAVQHGVALAVLTHLQKGEINKATAYFAESFHFNDHGIELEFTDLRQLADFFKKDRELYPESSLQLDRLSVSGDYVTIQWVRHTVFTEPFFFGGLSRKVSIALHGASIVRIEDGRIKEWSDYYDGLTSRRTSLAARFTEWIEY